MEEKIIKIQADPEIRDLIPRFLEHRCQDVARIKECLDKNDFGTIETLGHSMKGAGTGYGFQAISDIGDLIEQSAKRKDAAGIQNHVGQLANYLSRVVIDNG